MPTWVERMSLRRWYAIAGDHPDLELPATAPGTRYLLDSDPARDPQLDPPRTIKERLRRVLGRDPKSPWHGTAGFSAITEGWNGAAYASRYGVSGSMIIFGGGHDDGSPLPPHTYGYVQYDPVGNDYILFKGQTELGRDVKAVAIPHLFNLDSLRWRHGPRHPTAILNAGGWTTWDPPRRVVWGHSGDDGGGNAFIGFSPDGDNADGTFGGWGDHFPNKLPALANHNAMQIDPLRDIIVVSVHARDALYAIDPADPGRDIVRLKSTGSKPVLRPYAALEYAPNLARLVYFSPLDSGIVYTITATDEQASRTKFVEEWIWDTNEPAAGTLRPIADAARRSRYPVNVSHVFGRFRIASFGAIDVAILIRHIEYGAGARYPDSVYPDA